MSGTSVSIQPAIEVTARAIIHRPVRRFWVMAAPWCAGRCVGPRVHDARSGLGRTGTGGGRFGVPPGVGSGDRCWSLSFKGGSGWVRRAPRPSSRVPARPASGRLPGCLRTGRGVELRGGAAGRACVVERRGVRGDVPLLWRRSHPLLVLAAQCGVLAVAVVAVGGTSQSLGWLLPLIAGVYAVAAAPGPVRLLPAASVVVGLIVVLGAVDLIHGRNAPWT